MASVFYWQINATQSDKDTTEVKTLVLKPKLILKTTTNAENASSQRVEILLRHRTMEALTLSLSLSTSVSLSGWWNGRYECQLRQVSNQSFGKESRLAPESLRPCNWHNCIWARRCHGCLFRAPFHRCWHIMSQSSKHIICCCGECKSILQMQRLSHMRNARTSRAASLHGTMMKAKEQMTTSAVRVRIWPALNWESGDHDHPFNVFQQARREWRIMTYQIMTYLPSTRRTYFPVVIPFREVLAAQLYFRAWASSNFQLFCIYKPPWTYEIKFQPIPAIVRVTSNSSRYQPCIFQLSGETIGSPRNHQRPIPPPQLFFQQSEEWQVMLKLSRIWCFSCFFSIKVDWLLCTTAHDVVGLKSSKTFPATRSPNRR